MRIKNVNKTIIIEVAKKSNSINLDNKYSWVISNDNIDTARDPRLTNNKKFQIYTGQIQDKIDRLN